jgi:uncharacterized protein YbjT (DUF2867 family)
MTSTKKTTVILGGAGKTGRRVAERLARKGRPSRLASRSTAIPFDWEDEATWEATLAGAGAAYLTYYPDLAIPGAAERVRRLSRLAVDSGVERLVLLAGRGEPQVQPAEDAVRESGAAFTILECAFFNQNFDEGWVQPVGDVIAFPGGSTLEPFVDCDDIADVAVEAFTDPRHDGRTYELTGPRALSFGEAVETLARASGRPLRYAAVSLEAYGEMLRDALPPHEVKFFLDLFGWLMDGHNSFTTNDVRRVLGREPKDFRDYARDAAGGFER